MKRLAMILLGLGLIFSACEMDNVLDGWFLEEEAPVIEEMAKGDPAPDCPVLVENLDCEGKTKTVKFRADGTLSFLPPPEPCMYNGGQRMVVVEGTGKMSHLGLFNVRLTFCQGGEFPNVYPVSLPSGTVTAANGDQLFIYYSAPLGPDESGWQHYIINGGTGRFEYACGYWDFCGGVDYATLTFTHEGRGEIRY